VATEKTILIVKVDAKEADLAGVVDPAFLVAKTKGRFKYWFSDPADCGEAVKAIGNAFPAADCEVIEPARTFAAVKVEKDEPETEGGE
jgi:hypothetical protein